MALNIRLFWKQQYNYCDQLMEFYVSPLTLKQCTRNIQDVSRLVDITAGGDFLGLCDQKSSYKHVSNFGRLGSYGHFLIPVHALV